MSGSSSAIIGAIKRRGRAGLRRAWVNLKQWRHLPYSGIDHRAVMQTLSEDGGLTVRYCVLTALSCGIAILGLLLSSPAVVIGAMLISPLMSPIILLGFSLATLNGRQAIRSLKAIAVGVVLAIGQAAAIVWLSPLNAVTPEILARTRPNFFDLLVAIFSGIAGAYAVAQEKGETIVGVAIATALMPPLAVIGYGLAVQNWAIFDGAGGLFMTNLLAIGLTASLVAKFFGFGAHSDTPSGLWHTLGIFMVFAVLSIPLGLSLKQLANEAVLTHKVRGILDAHLAPPADHIYGINIAFPNGQPVEVEALVLTQKVRPGLESRIRALLEKTLGQTVALSLSQVPVHPHESLDRQAVEELVSQSNASLSASLTKEMHAQAPDMATVAAAEAQVPVLNVSVDDAGRQVLVRGAAADAQRLAALRAAQAALAKKYPGWKVAVRPDVAALPAIAFANGGTTPDAAGKALLDNIVWALKQGGVGAVRVTGYADTHGKSAVNRRVARARANAVAAILETAGLSANPVADYPAPGQRRIEREQGAALFRVARVTPALP